MDPHALMQSYNQHERIHCRVEGKERVATPSLVKHVAKGQTGFISYFQLDEQSADATIETEIAYFTELGQSFEWKVYGMDSPADMAGRLRQHGFVPEEEEAFMVLDLAKVPAPRCPQETICVEAVDEAAIQDALTVQGTVWGRDPRKKAKQLFNQKTSHPDSLTIYVIYADGKPVSSAWIEYTPESPFAGIWGGSTLAGYRGRGYYSALLHRRIDDAKRRGVAYLTIDASAMSRPIVERHGFVFVTHTTPYEYLVA